jgi:hypothetical protein
MGSPADGPFRPPSRASRCIHRIAHGLDLLSLLVRDADVEVVLEFHHDSTVSSESAPRSWMKDVVS